MKIKNKLMKFGAFLEEIWYLTSPIIFFKIFQMILIIDNNLLNEFKGATWIIVYILFLLICYGTTIYRIFKTFIKEK